MCFIKRWRFMAALQWPDGKITTGPHHHHAALARTVSDPVRGERLFEGVLEGYVDDTGEFLTRTEVHVLQRAHEMLDARGEVTIDELAEDFGGAVQEEEVSELLEAHAVRGLVRSLGDGRYTFTVDPAAAITGALRELGPSTIDQLLPVLPALTRRQLIRELRELVKAGRIDSDGHGRGARYRAAEQL